MVTREGSVQAGGGRWRSAALAALRTLAVVALCTGISELMHTRFDLADIIMVYLAGVVWVALREPVGASVGAVLASIFLFDLLYVPPRFGLNPINQAHFVTFGVMLVVGLLIGRLAQTARDHARRTAEARMAAEAERLRSTLLSGISHDVRTPLTTIVGAATTLVEQDARLTPELRASLAASIAAEARRLQDRVAEALELTRLEEGGVRPECEWCPADDLVAESLEAVRARLAGHTVALDVPGDAIVWCDPRLVSHAIVNLLDNASRHTPAGTTVHVAVRTAGRWWMLEVSDDGPGLPAGREQEMLEKYSRAAPERRGGFGLGLAICAAVARLHGGTIEARNAGGAAFTLRLPQPAAPALEEEPA